MLHSDTSFDVATSPLADARFSHFREGIQTLALKIQDGIPRTSIKNCFRSDPAIHLKLAERIWSNLEKVLPTHTTREGLRVLIFPVGKSIERQHAYALFVRHLGEPIGGVALKPQFTQFATRHLTQALATLEIDPAAGNQNAPQWKSFSSNGRLKDEALLTFEALRESIGERWKQTMFEELSRWIRQSDVLSGPLPRNPNKHLRPLHDHLLQPSVDAIVADRINYLRPFLSEPIVSTLEGAHQFSPQKYNFCVGTSGAEAQLRRARWIASYPGFYEFARLQPDEIAAIDQGLSFEQVAAQERSVTPVTIRRVKAFTSPVISNGLKPGISIKTPEFEQLIKTLDALPQGTVPDLSHHGLKEEQSKAFAWALTGSSAFIDRCISGPWWSEKKRELLTGLLQRSVGKMSEIGASVEKRYPLAIDELSDFMSAASKALILTPYLVTYGMPTEADKRITQIAAEGLECCCELLTHNRNIAQLFHLSDLWHKQAHRGTGTSVSGYSFWNALCSAQIAPNGCHLIPLTDSTALTEEGRTMHHCVGGYSHRCLTTGTHIFSVRAQDGVTRLSTLTLTEVTQDPVRIKVSQNRTEWNLDPSQEASRAANWLTDEINEGKIKVNLEELECARAEYRLASQANSICGVDIARPAAAQRYFQEYRDYLPRQLYKENLESYRLQPAIACILKALDQRLSVNA